MVTADVESVAVHRVDAANKLILFLCIFFGMGVNGVWQHVVSSF